MVGVITDLSWHKISSEERDGKQHEAYEKENPNRAIGIQRRARESAGNENVGGIAGQINIKREKPEYHGASDVTADRWSTPYR